MKKIVLDNIEYELIEDNGDSFDENEIKEKYTDYFYEFDYILGDYAYNKLRLKGFCDKNNKCLSVCGELASIVDIAVNFYKIGIKNLSVSPSMMKMLNKSFMKYNKQ